MTYDPTPPRPRIIIHPCVNGEYPSLQEAAAPPPDDRPIAAEPDPPPPGEGDHPQGGGEAPAKTPDAATSADPPAPRPRKPADGEEPDPARSERNRVISAWLNKHWQVVEAMARAGEAPQRPPPPPPPEPAKPPPPVHVRRGDRWTKPKMAEFLRQLAATHSVSAAAKAVGMHRRSAHKLRARLKGQPFDIAWEVAFRQSYDNLAHAALELALEGEEVPHYYQGELKGTHRKHNANLMVQLLKMRNSVGAPMLGRYGAAAEWWGDRWDLLLERVETGSVDWSDEREALGDDGLARLELPDAKREVDQLIERNGPDVGPKGR